MVDDANPSLATPQFSKRYTAYAIGLLAVVNLNNYMDRMVLSVLLPDIQADLNLTDAQLGWITGMAFALFYATFGIPIARLADVSIRKRVVSAALVGWSIMTMLSGAAGNFFQLFLARIGVGIGEAGCIPPSHSLISDLTPPEKRAGALALFTAGATIGTMLGLALGGWLSETVGWRLTFVFFGMPGFVLAILMIAAFKEPIRGQFDKEPKVDPSTMKQSVRGLLKRRSYFHILMAFGLATFVSFGFSQWLPTYYIRTFELSMTEIGIMFGFAFGAGMTVGTIAGGFIANRLMPKDMRWGVWISIAAMLAVIPANLLLLSMQNYHLAFFFNFVAATVGGAANGPLFAIVQSVAKSNERATATALVMFAASILGIGGGPLLVGYLSDWFISMGMENSLNAALSVTACIAIWPIFHLLICGRHLNNDIHELNRR